MDGVIRMLDEGLRCPLGSTQMAVSILFVIFCREASCSLFSSHVCHSLQGSSWLALSIGCTCPFCYSCAAAAATRHHRSWPEGSFGPSSYHPPHLCGLHAHGTFPRRQRRRSSRRSSKCVCRLLDWNGILNTLFGASFSLFFPCLLSLYFSLRFSYFITPLLWSSTPRFFRQAWD